VYITGDDGVPEIDTNSFSDSCRPLSQLRTIFYVAHTAITDDVSMQMNGLVLVMNVKCFNLLRDFDRLFIRKCTDLFTHALPVKVMAIHLCLASHGRNIFGVILPILKKIITKRFRLHVKFHNGHDSDLLRELKEHGISPESTHKALGGKYTDKMFTAWLKRR
jgi:hypothetical protein